jgi:hypothetical protein
MLLPTLQPVLFLSLMIIVKAAQIRISGSISNDTQFYSNSTYLIENDLVVEYDATLTIMPNVTIEINENSSIMVMGKLDFLGTQSQPISLRYIRNGAISDYYFEINIIFYSYFAKSSTILNLNIFANISVNYCVYCRLFRVETSYSHRFENITVINQGQYTWRVRFNNLDNPLKKTKITGLNLKNTEFFANSVLNFELLNSIFIESPSTFNYYGSSSPDYSYQYISNRLPSQNFSKIVTVINQYLSEINYEFFMQDYYFSGYTNQVYLNESDAIYSISALSQPFHSNLFLFELVIPANSLQLLLTIYTSNLNYNNVHWRFINIYFWDYLITMDWIRDNAYYSFNLTPRNSSYTLFLAIVVPFDHQVDSLDFHEYYQNRFFKFSISNEAPANSSSGFLIKDSYFHKSNLRIDSYAKTRIDSIVFNNSDSFTYEYRGGTGGYGGDIEIVNSQITNCQNLYFDVTYREYFEMSNNLFSNNVMSVRATSYYSNSARSSFVIRSNSFLRSTGYYSDFLIRILATSNVSISNNTFNNNATTSNIENREFILQIQDETQNETTYDLSMNNWLTLNSTILVHSYYYSRFLTVKLNKSTYAQVDSLASLFLNESQTTIVLKKTSSPYYLRSRLTIGIHQTLIVEPGVEIRAMIDGVIVVYGSLILNGTSSLPIVIDGSRTNDYFNDPIVSRRETEKQLLIYFFMKTNQTASILNHVNFRNFYDYFYDDAHKIMTIDGYMPKLSNLNFDYRPNEICVIQAFDEKISFENLNIGGNGVISISSLVKVNIEISNVNINSVRILPPWSILGNTYYTNNLDIFCNLGNLNSYYVSSLDSRASTVILNRIYKLPCQICFTTDLGSHFSILTRGNVPVDITDVNQNSPKTLSSVFTGDSNTTFTLSNQVCITFKSRENSVIIRAYRQDPIFALNDFASANSTYLFSNLFRANVSYRKIENMSLNFYTVSNSSSVMSFESNQIENKNDSLKKIVGILFYINTPIPLELLVNIRCLNKTYEIDTKLTSALSGKVQIYFKSDIIKTINTNQFALGFDLSCQSLNRSVTIQLTNFTLLSIFEENNVYETSVNYRIVDSTLRNFQIYQHEFDSYKMTNIEISNVVFDYLPNYFFYYNDDYVYSNTISISMVSLNSLNIKDCIFQENSFNFRSLIDVNTFVPDGPSNTLFYQDSGQKFPIYYNPLTFSLNGDAFLRKYYNSSSQIQIVNNIFQNNPNTFGIITIYEQCSSMDYYQQVKIINNSFINNKVKEHLIGYINEMKVKYVQIEGNIFFSNYLYTPTDDDSWLRCYPYLSNRTGYCSNGTMVQTRASCLIALFMTNENEIPNNVVSITRNLFHRNRIEGTSDLCFFSTFKNCSNTTTSMQQPILIRYNAFMNNILNNSSSFGSSYSYFGYPFVKKVAEVFGLDDDLDLSLNWWNTKSAQDVSAKIISSALISNDSYLYKSEQRLLTSLPDLFGLRSTLCGNLWYEHENKCYFTISSSLTYEMAVQTCSSLNGSIASYSNELIGFVKSTRNSSSLWLRNSSCIVLMNDSLILNKTQCKEKNNFVCEQDAVYVPPTCSDGISQPFGNNSFCNGQNLICARGYTGPDCSQFFCPYNCSKHGKCVGPSICECDNNWKGSYCSVNIFIIHKRVVTNIENKIPHNFSDINSFSIDFSSFKQF